MAQTTASLQAVPSMKLENHPELCSGLLILHFPIGDGVSVQHHASQKRPILRLLGETFLRTGIGQQHVAEAVSKIVVSLLAC